MDLVSFIMSLSSPAAVPPDQGGGDPVDLVLDDSVVTFTGTQSKSGGITGHYLWSPRGLWHEGKTYISYPSPHTIEALGQLYMIIYDENDGLKKPYRFGSPMILHPEYGVADTHIVPSFMIDNDGVLYALQERTHDTPIDIYKGTSFNNFELLAEKINPGAVGNINNESSYHNLIKLENGNVVSWCRMGKLFESYSGGHGAAVEASDGMESWGALIRNTTNPRPMNSDPGSGTDKTRHYPNTPYYRQIVGDYIYLLRSQRVDNYTTGLGIWHKFYVMRTPKGSGRFTLFENLLGTPYTHDITGADYMTETDLDTNFLYYNSGDDGNNAFTPIATLSLEPKLYIVTGDAGTSDLLLHIIDVTARTLVTKSINIPDLYAYSPSSVQEHAVRHIAYIESGEYLELGVDIDHGGGVIKGHLFRTYDEGDTYIDRGDMFPEIATTTYFPAFPFNYYDIPDNRNFLVTTLAPDAGVTNGMNVYCKRAAKGELQSETPNVVVPAASYSDANDFFHYVAQDGMISRSGNNVTGLTDQFGLRNATGVNNPQWNGSDAITLNGTNQEFSIGTTGFSSLTKCTFFAVVRRTSATMPGILFISNNALSLSYIAWFLNDGGAGNTPSFRFVEQGGSTLIDHGQYVPAQDEDLLVAWVSDGRCKTDIYVNGAKQYYQTTNYSTLAQYSKRGLMNYGTVNSVRIGKRDISGTDLFFPFAFKRLLMKNTVYDYETFRALEKKIADAHSITLNYGYQ